VLDIAAERLGGDNRRVIQKTDGKEPGVGITGDVGADAIALIALVESPQVCSPKFLTCEQRSV
jgi:hypothetical protein